MRESIANEVNKLRLKLGLTQEELGREVSVSRQTIIAIEKGNYTPSVALALKLAEALKTPVEKIFKIIYE